MKKVILFFLACFTLVEADALIARESHQDFSHTVEALKQQLTRHHMDVLDVIDQRAIAHKGSMDINDEQVIMFANPNYNSRMILNDPNVALELPMRIAVYRDYSGKVWIVYRDPIDLKNNYKLSHCGVLPELHDILDDVTRSVSKSK